MALVGSLYKQVYRETYLGDKALAFLAEHLPVRNKPSDPHSIPHFWEVDVCLRNRYGRSYVEAFPQPWTVHL